MVFYTWPSRGGRVGEGCANEQQQYRKKNNKILQSTRAMMMINEASKQAAIATTKAATTTIDSRQAITRDNKSNNANNTHAGNSRTCLCHNFKLLSHAQRTDNASDGGGSRGPRDMRAKRQQQRQRRHIQIQMQAKDTNTFSRYSSQQPLSYTRCHKVQQLGGRRGNRCC